MVAKAWDSRLSLPSLIVERRAVVDGIVQMFGRLAAPHGICPSCGTPSGSCHSRYDRTLSDLPISGARVELRLSVRRFRCGHAPCSRRTFSEPLPSVIGRRLADGSSVATRCCTRWAVDRARGLGIPCASQPQRALV